MIDLASIQPGFEILGVYLDEPVTTITDLMVSAACLFAFYKLQIRAVPGRTVFYMKIYFLCMALATSLGGLLGHGFLYAVDENWKLLGWVTSMGAIMVIERSAIEHARNLVHPFLHKGLLILNIVELVVLVILAVYTLNFKFVEFHTVYGILGVVFSFHLFVFIKTRNKGSKFYLYGIAVLIGAMAAFNIPIVVHKYFNQSDLAHILMTIGSLFFLKGTMHLEEGKLREIKL